MGTPGKFGAEQQDEYLKILERHPIKKHAAGYLGLTRQAVDYHREKNPEFTEAELKALEIGRGKLLRMVDDAKWLLQKSDPETYTDRNKVEADLTHRTYEISERAGSAKAK